MSLKKTLGVHNHLNVYHLRDDTRKFDLQNQLGYANEIKQQMELILFATFQCHWLSLLVETARLYNAFEKVQA